MGIEKEVLDYFASKCPPDECIVEILDFWLRNHKEQVTWKDVARALKVINLQQLALDIESIYTTGNYIKINALLKRVLAAIATLLIIIIASLLPTGKLPV